MKSLYLSLDMGAAGDMLAAALYELLDDEKKQEFIDKMNAILPEGVCVAAEPNVKCGITGTHFAVSVNGEEELSEDDHEHHHHHHEHDHDHDHHRDHHHEHDHAHDHEHEHDHGHHHHEHRGLADIERIVSGMPLSERCRNDIMAVYALIAEAESKAHGRPAELVHFHEVGALDAVADITAVCLLIEMLAPDSIAASPVRTGFGSVKCAHGILPVPAPATAHILMGIPSYAGEIRGELCTPTGAALVRHFAREYSHQSEMRVERIGYGMGKKDFPQANCVRAVLGKTDEGSGEIAELVCSVDDMTGEEIGFALEALLDMGARDAYYIPIGMKKSRPGVMLCVLCDKARREEFVRAVFKLTSTLGVRERACKRYELERGIEAVQTEFGEMRVKKACGFGVKKEKAEYEDAARLARERGVSIFEAKRLIESASCKAE